MWHRTSISAFLSLLALLVSSIARELPTKRSIWALGSSGSDQFFVQGTLYRLQQAGGVVIIAAARDVGDYFQIQLLVDDKSGGRFDLDPSRMTLKADDGNPKDLPYISPDIVSHHINRRSRWAAALTAAGASLQTTSATATTQNGEQIRITLPDESARAAGQRKVDSIHAHAANKMAGVKSTSLYTETMQPGDERNGFVYFKRDKHCRKVVLTIPIADQEIVIPLDVQGR